MHTSKVSAFLFGFVLLASCGSTADHPAPAQKVDATTTPRDLGDIDAEPVQVDLAKAGAFLVWTREDDGCAESHRIDASGHELETMDGIWIATATGTWQWREEDWRVVTAACERYDDEGALLRAPEPEPGSATRVTLEEAKGRAVQVLVEPAVEPMAPKTSVTASSSSPRSALGFSCERRRTPTRAAPTARPVSTR